MLTVWGRANSINVQKVMWTVAELGVEHQRIDLGGDYGGLDTPEHLARNPHGLIPVIDENGTQIWESHAIVRYLCAKHGDGSLWPSEPAERATADMWMEWAQTVLQRDFIQLFWDLFRTPPDQQDAVKIQMLTEKCAQDFLHLNSLLADKPFITGNHLTYGDIPVATQFYRYFTLEIERPHVPNVEAWYERLSGTPTYADHVMVPYEDLRARSAP